MPNINRNCSQIQKSMSTALYMMLEATWHLKDKSIPLRLLELYIFNQKMINFNFFPYLFMLKKYLN